MIQPPTPHAPTSAQPDHADARQLGEALLFEIRRVIVGQDVLLERLLVALLATATSCSKASPDWPRHSPSRRSPTSSAARSTASSSRPISCPPTSSARASTNRDRRVRHRARAGLRQPRARRRDQPRAGQGPVGLARGDAGATGDDRSADVRRAEPVPGDGDAEPDRVRGHLSAARSTGRPIHDEGVRRLSVGGRGGRGRGPVTATRRSRRSRAQCRNAGHLQASHRRRIRRPRHHRLRRAAGQRHA